MAANGEIDIWLSPTGALAVAAAFASGEALGAGCADAMRPVSVEGDECSSQKARVQLTALPSQAWGVDELLRWGDDGEWPRGSALLGLEDWAAGGPR